MKNIQASYHKISWPQDFRGWNFVDLRWNLTSTRNKRVISSIWQNHIPSTKYRHQFLTVCTWGLKCLTYGDPKWPFSPPKMVRFFYQVQKEPAFSACDVVWTGYSLLEYCWPGLSLIEIFASIILNSKYCEQGFHHWLPVTPDDVGSPTTKKQQVSFSITTTNKYIKYSFHRKKNSFHNISSQMVVWSGSVRDIYIRRYSIPWPCQ